MNKTKETIETDAAAEGVDPAPYIAVVGDPFVSTTYYIVGEGQIILEGSGSVREAAFILIGMYYTCMVEYPKKAFCTFKFMQHELLGIGNDGSSVPSKLANFVKLLH